MAYLNFGFHTGIGGDPGGLVAYGEKLLRAGRPFTGKAVADAGRLMDLQQMYVRLRLEGVDCEEPVLVWRHAGAEWDVPNYSLDPRPALDEQWAKHDNAWPRELDPGLVWREIVNEPDKDRADWLGWFCYYGGLKAVETGTRFCGPGFAGGEPEPEHWQTPGMIAFLELCHNHPDSVMVATHAYSLDNYDLRTGYPWMIGREMFLVDTCQAYGFDKARFVITEFGWGRDMAPDWPSAMEQLLWAGEIYAALPGYSGAAIWFLGNGEWGDLYKIIRTYVVPLGNLAVEIEYPDPDPGDSWEEAAIKASISEQIARGIPLNADAGLQRAIFASGRTPVHREIDFEQGGRRHVIQAGEDVQGILPRQVWYWDGAARPIVEPVPVPPPVGIGLFWPSEYNQITQHFRANPEYYRKWGFPGHEGIDFRAPHWSGVRCCADGEVYRIYTKADLERQWHNYGVHVRVVHEGADGRTYKTIYAHLAQEEVREGQKVTKGQLIGRADNTGNSFGSHLHLTLKCVGATERGETDYPFDIIDPTPYLEAFHQPIDWPFESAMAGVHGRADGTLEQKDEEALRVSKLKSVFLLGNAHPSSLDRIRSTVGDCFVSARLFASFRDRVVTPADFVEWVRDDTDRLYNAGIRYFQIHNEPNLNMEGMWISWNENTFAPWLAEAADRLRQRYPAIKLGYPGLSPGHDIPYHRKAAKAFFNASIDAVKHCDWLGVHCYWVNPAEMIDPEHGRGFEWYHLQFPKMPILITEFSNPAYYVPASDKGHQYVAYYRGLPKYVGAAYSFVLSASSQFGHEIWRHEDGSLTPIPGIVGNR